MPLHLLGKKSWNVFNHDNVERVKRDEAEAAAKEEAEEQRMQEIDSKRRIRQLQGLPVEDLQEEPKDEQPTRDKSRTYGERDRKRRRLPGEDDTERDIRFAREAQSREPSSRTIKSRKSTHDASLHDTTGHINLFPEDRQHRTNSSQGNPEAEREKARKERELEDQYTMRFSNAAGFKQATDKKPWYFGESIANDADQEMPTMNVWGDDDPRRKQREQVRIASDDPLAIIQRGVKGVREAQKDRDQWKAKQRQEIDVMIKEERRSAKRRQHKEDELEDFSLDAGLSEKASRVERAHSRHRSHDRDRRRRSESPGVRWGRSSRSDLYR